MSEQLEQDLRTHAFDDCGEREVPAHIANIAANTLKRYREALVEHNCGTPGCICYQLCREADVLSNGLGPG